MQDATHTKEVIALVTADDLPKADVLATARIAGPAVASNLFAWSASRGDQWPFNYHLVFYLQVCLPSASA